MHSDRATALLSSLFLGWCHTLAVSVREYSASRRSSLTASVPCTPFRFKSCVRWRWQRNRVPCAQFGGSSVLLVCTGSTL
eukprot:4060672-Pleurochrysis_carterae.AAC.1